MKRQLGLVLATIAWLRPDIAVADTQERFRHYLAMSLEELMAQTVTISTHAQKPLKRAPSVVTVITADDIRATGATNLAEVLQSVPGIHVKYSHFGFRPLIRFRGANDKQTLVMVDGAPMSDLMWRLGIYWKGLPTSVIDRVEIIRGPGSALFGTDAAAGVINVITRAAAGIDGSEAGFRSGSFDSHSAWIQHGGDWAGFDLAATLDVSTTDGHSPFVGVDAQTRNDASFGTSASFAPADAGYGYRNTDLRLSLARDAWRIHADYTRHDDLETGMTGAGALDPLTQGSDSRLDLGLNYTNGRLADHWGLNGELRYRHVDYTSGAGFREWPPGYTDASGLYPDGVFNLMQSAERELSGEISGVFDGLDGHSVTIGAGFRWQDLYEVSHRVNSGVDRNGNPLPAGGALVDLSDSPYAFAPEKSRTIRYLYLQDVWTLSDDWELTAGARYDHHSDFGGALNPRAALVWQTTDRLTTKLMVGRAFRAPYFQELFAETSFTLPNPGLDPERSETWELSLAYAASPAVHLGMNLFHLQQTDFISPQPVAGLAKPQYRNSGELVIRGFELEGWWQVMSTLRLAANFAYNDPDASPFHEADAPPRQAYLRADWRFRPGWHWNLQGNWVDERGRSGSDPRPPVDDYRVIDTTLRYLGIPDWEFALSVRNLLDADARDATRSTIVNDLPLPGRSLYVEARYDFGS